MLRSQFDLGDTPSELFGREFGRKINEFLRKNERSAHWLKYLEEFGNTGANAALRNRAVRALNERQANIVLAAAKTVGYAPSIEPRGHGYFLFATCANIPCDEEITEYYDAGFTAKTTSLPVAWGVTKPGEKIFVLHFPDAIKLLPLEFATAYINQAQRLQVIEDHEVMTCPGQQFELVEKCIGTRNNGDTREFFFLEYAGNIYARSDPLVHQKLEDVLINDLKQFTPAYENNNELTRIFRVIRDVTNRGLPVKIEFRNSDTRSWTSEILTAPFVTAMSDREIYEYAAGLVDRELTIFVPRFVNDEYPLFPKGFYIVPVVGIRAFLDPQPEVSTSIDPLSPVVAEPKQFFPNANLPPTTATRAERYVFLDNLLAPLRRAMLPFRYVRNIPGMAQVEQDVVVIDRGNADAIVAMTAYMANFLDGSLKIFVPNFTPEDAENFRTYRKAFVHDLEKIFSASASDYQLLDATEAYENHPRKIYTLEPPRRAYP